MQMGGEHTAAGRSAGRGIQDHRSGSVAKQNAGAAVLPVEDPRKRLGSDHQRRARLAQPQRVVGDREREDEPRAHRLHIEGGAAGHAKPRLQLDRGRREGFVGSCGRQHDQIEVAAADAGALQGAARRVECKVRRQFALGGDASLDSAAISSPTRNGLPPVAA